MTPPTSSKPQWSPAGTSGSHSSSTLKSLSNPNLESLWIYQNTNPDTAQSIHRMQTSIKHINFQGIHKYVPKEMQGFLPQTEILYRIKRELICDEAKHIKSLYKWETEIN